MFTTDNDSIFRNLVGAVGTLVFAGACLIAAAGPVNAAEAPRAQVVTYSDLDLAHTNGRNALESRINAAAHSVCSSGLDGVRARIEEARCVRAAVNSAKRTVAAAAPAYQG